MGGGSRHLQCRHSSRRVHNTCLSLKLFAQEAVWSVPTHTCSGWPLSLEGFTHLTSLPGASRLFFPFDKLANLWVKKMKLHSEVSVKCLAVRMCSLRCSDPPASVCKLALLL